MADTQFRGDNHYVPHSYLKRWAAANGRIWAYRILVPHEKVHLWKPASPKGAAYHKHLYTRRIATGETDAIERWLDAEFESPAQAAIQKVVDGDRMTSQDWALLVRFLAAQDVRTPAALMKALQGWGDTLQADMQATLENLVSELETGKRAGRPLPVVAASEQEEFPCRVRVEAMPDLSGGVVCMELVAGRNLWLWNLRHLLSSTCNVLLRHRWTVLRSPPGISWATSDNPVIRLNYYSHQQYDFGGGWAKPGTEIFLPLSPRHLLFTQVGAKPAPRGTVMPLDHARLIQRLTAEHAHRIIFSTSQDPVLPRLRPRTVDAMIFANEQAQWKNWNEEQSAAEQQLHGW